MDHTIRNADQIHQALSSLNISRLSDNPIDNINQYNTLSSNNNEPNNIQYTELEKLSSKDRNSTTQMSTASILRNLSALQTQNNSKIDLLIDSINRMSYTLQVVHEEQVRHTEILSAIARNTAMHNTPQGSVIDSKVRSRNSNDTIKSYGFIDTTDLVAELVHKIITEAESQINSQGKRYRSKREIKANSIKSAVSIACKAEFKAREDIQDTQVIKLPDNKNSIMVQLATKLATIEGIMPVLDGNSLRSILTNDQFRTISVTFQSIMERLRIIRIILPYYEADIINAITFPFFDKEGKIICDWNKINNRLETSEESIVITQPVTIQKKIATIIAKGGSPRSAIKACVEQKNK